MRGCVLVFLLLGGCGGSLPHQSRVEELRILAITAEPPEARPGEPVTLRALWFAPSTTRPPHFSWSQCILEDAADPASCPGAPQPIAEGDALDLVQVQLPTAEGTVLVRLEMCGTDCADGPIEAFKRIQVSTRSPWNGNPSIASLALDPPDGVRPGTTARLSVTVDPASAETYTNEEGTTSTEELLVSWFATDGSFEEERSIGAPFEVDWKAPEEPGQVEGWGVLRDGRGGVSWEPFSINVVGD